MATAFPSSTLGPIVSPTGHTILHTDSGRHYFYVCCFDADAGRVGQRRLWRNLTDAHYYRTAGALLPTGGCCVASLCLHGGLQSSALLGMGPTGCPSQRGASDRRATSWRPARYRARRSNWMYGACAASLVYRIGSYPIEIACQSAHESSPTVRATRSPLAMHARRWPRCLSHEASAQQK